MSLVAGTIGILEMYKKNRSRDHLYFTRPFFPMMILAQHGRYLRY
jgi:hypothetical protein